MAWGGAWGDAWGDAWAPAAPAAPVASTTSATPFPRYQGPQQRFRTEEERHQLRIELGILPAPVKQAVEKAVRRVINKAKAEVRNEPQSASVDPIAWLQAHHAQEQLALTHELHKRDLSFEIRYMALVRFEVERHAMEQARIEQERDDEHVLVLFLGM